MKCRECGCSEYDPCFDEVTGEPCGWAEPDRCTACAEANPYPNLAAAGFEIP